MALFGIGVLISLINFWKTIAARKNKEIYVSNWYIISSMMYVFVIAFRNNNPRILHASGCWNMIYALLFRADVLLSSTTIKQTYLFLQFGNSSILDTDLVLHRYRNTSLYLQCHSVVVTNSGYCRKYGNGDSGYCRNNKLFNRS